MIAIGFVQINQPVSAVNLSAPKRKLFISASSRSTPSPFFSSYVRVSHSFKTKNLAIHSSSRPNSTLATSEPDVIADEPAGISEFPTSEVAKCSALVALRARLELGASFDLTTLAQALNCPSSELASRFPSNESLSELGARLLDFYVSEFIICSYPRLPMEVIKEALWSYCGDDALTSVGRHWGIERERPQITTVGKGARLIKEQRLVDYFGVLKYGRMVVGRSNGLTEYVDPVNEDGTERGVERYSTAMSNFVRSVIGGICLHNGRDVAKEFIFNHILSRKLDISKLFRFEQPTRELSRLCSREHFAPPISRMIAETGRFSQGSVYVVGIYSGSNMLGSAEGRSIAEAETRAAINALKSWYLYSPHSKLPSTTEGKAEADFQQLYVDPGQVIV